MRRRGAMARRGALVCGALVALIVSAASCISGDFPERPVDTVQQGGQGGTRGQGGGGTGGVPYDGGAGEARSDAALDGTAATGGAGGTDGGDAGGSGGGRGTVGGADAADAGRDGDAGGTGGASGSGGIGGTDGGVDSGDAAGSGGTGGAGGTDGGDACVAETDSAFCARFGKNCGTITTADNCGNARTAVCGTCILPQTCSGGGTSNACGCAAETDATFCARLGKNCGNVTAADYCTTLTRTAACGTCTSPQFCSVTNTCCGNETNAAFCTRLGKNCGNVTANDNCGVSRTVTSCGVCTLPQTCGGDNVCACVSETDAAFCSRLRKNCGAVSGNDNCGVSRTVTSCGTCISPQDCNDNNICQYESCAGGLLCNGESCCTSINVPGGTFPQGRSQVVGASDYVYDPGGLYPDEVPEFSSTVSSFALDKYEVSVGRFRKFVDAYVSNATTVPVEGAGANPAVPASGWQSAWNTSLPDTRAAFLDPRLTCDPNYHTWTDSVGANESKPINCVSWYEAFAFCAWDGGRLPTESEWECAAAGGADNRMYPWGQTTPDCTRANSSGCVGGTNSILAVGSTTAGNGKWGHADQIGNVSEWVLDWYDTYPVSPSTNYAKLSALNGYCVFRGGAFSSAPARAASRYFGGNGLVPTGRSIGLGFRCARTAP